MGLGGHALVERGHGLGEQLLHGGHNLGRGGHVGQAGRVLFQPGLDLSKSCCISRLLGLEAAFEVADGFLEIRDGLWIHAGSIAPLQRDGARRHSRQEDRYPRDRIQDP